MPSADEQTRHPAVATFSTNGMLFRKNVLWTINIYSLDLSHNVSGIQIPLISCTARPFSSPRLGTRLRFTVGRGLRHLASSLIGGRTHRTWTVVIDVGCNFRCALTGRDADNGWAVTVKVDSQQQLALIRPRNSIEGVITVCILTEHRQNVGNVGMLLVPKLGGSARAMAPLCRQA